MIYPPYGMASVTITGVPTFVKTISNTVTVSSDTIDPNPNDNTVMSYTTVNRLSDDDIMDFPMTLGITEFSTNFHFNSGTGSITMSGIGFDSQTTITLIGEDGTVYNALDVAINSGSSLDAMFDMGLIPVGRYDVQVSNALGSYVVPNGFEIVIPQPRVEARLILPSSFRRNSVGTIYIEYENTGNVAVPAPMLKLVSADENNSDKPILTLDSSRIIQNFWSSSKPPSGSGHSVSFLADGDGESPGVLELGESGRVPVYYMGLLQPWDFSDTRVELEVLMIKGDDPTSFGWDDSDYQAEMKPDTIDQSAWDLIYNNVAAGVGPTWGDYISTLSENAEYLYQHGGKDISDIRKLMQFEMLQAVGHSPISVLAGGADISVDAPGMDIVFGKFYKNSMISRHTPGPLGMGWTHNWQLSVQEEQNGNVVFNSMNNRSTYALKIRGGYFSPAGNFSTLSKSGDIFTITAASGMKMVFHPNGSLNYVEDLNKNRITAEYSGELLTRLVHSSGQYLAFNYSGGIIQSVTDHTGELAVQYTYQDEQLSGVVGVTGKTTNYSYLTSGQGFRALSEVIQTDDTRLSYEYDGNGRLMTGSFNDTPEFTLAYDLGTVMVINPIEGTTQSYFYDEAGNFVEYRDPLGRITKLKYNTDHALVGMVQPDGTTSSFKYDTKGNLIQHIDPLEQVTKFSYGAHNRLTGLTDANAHTTAYGYDPSGNNTSRTSPDLTAQSYTYDPSGELVAKTNRRGTPTQIIRDYNGRILRIDYNDNTFVAYSYNSVGAIISVEDVTGITTMEYTDNHQLRRITYPGDRFLEYTYDLAGRRASMLDHTGYQLNYAYNSDGLLETISDGTGITHAHYIYDAQGRLVSRTVGNGVSTTWQYDPGGMVSAVDSFDDTGAVISYYHYEYDTNDRRTQMTSLDGTWDYTYDATGQLVRALFTSTNEEVESKDIEYVYDAVGNRVSEIINGNVIEYSVNSMNQYSRAGAFSYLYDTDGNLIQKTNGSDTWTYEYNADNRLIRSTGPEEDKVYTYNGLGQLATLIENGVERHYLVDPFGFGNIVGEYDKDGNQHSRYTHGLGLLGKDDYYYTFDGNGNTSELTDEASEIVNYYLYEPFGNSLYALEQSENDFEYVGQFGIMRMSDDLVYMHNRFYSPSLGRFMAEDPIGLAGGDVSFYRYVGNDPVNFVDPVGLAQVYLKYDWSFKEYLDKSKKYTPEKIKPLVYALDPVAEGVDDLKHYEILPEVNVDVIIDFQTNPTIDWSEGSPPFKNYHGLDPIEELDGYFIFFKFDCDILD